MSTTPVIDAHLHVWRLPEPAYPYAPESKLHPDFPGTVEILQEGMAAAGVARAVIVQPDNYLYDHRYLADCLKDHPDILAGVCLVDEEQPDAAERLEKLTREDGFFGLRLRPGIKGSAEWIRSAACEPLWRTVMELGIPIKYLGLPEHLEALAWLAGRLEHTTFIVDHLGNPGHGDKNMADDLPALLALVRLKNVLVQVSPLARLYDHVNPTPIGVFHAGHPAREVNEFIRRVYEAFGPERLLWGTDFPWSLQVGKYGLGLELFREQLDFIPPEDREQILGKTAAGVWFAEG